MKEQDKETKLKKYLLKLVDRKKKFYDRKNQVWSESEAQYLSKFYKKYNKVIQSMADLEREDENTVRTSANHSFTFVRALHSMIVSNQPSVSVFPTTNDEVDKEAAQVADRVARYERRRSGMDSYVSRFILDCLRYGTGILKVFWDPNDGDLLDKDEILFEGNVRNQNISPRNFWFDHTQCNWRDVKWCLEEIYMDTEEAREKWKEHAEHINDSEIQKKYNADTMEEEDTEGKCRVFQYWEKKCHTNGFKGKFVEFTEDGVILSNKDHPYSHGQLPYVIFTDIDVPDTLWGKSILEMLSDPQKTINGILSRIMDNINAHCVIRIAVPKGSGIQENAVSNDPLDLIEYNGAQGTPPMQLQPASLPQHVFTMYDMLVNVMEHISGLRSFSRGEMSKNVSGFAGQLMIEQDQKVHIQLHNKYKESVEQIFRHHLSLCKEFWREERSVTVMGTEKRYIVRKYDQSNLNGHYDVQVQYGTSLPTDPASRRAAIIELWREGIIQDQTQILKALQVGDEFGVFSNDNAIDAQKEEIEIFKNQPEVDFGIEEYEDHQSHVNYLLDFFQTQEYRELEPEVQEKIKAHAKLHEEKIKELVAASQPPPPEGEQGAIEGTPPIGGA